MSPQWHDIILLFLPGLIAIINKPGWSDVAKFSVAIGVCFVAALIESMLTGTCNWSDLPGTFGKVAIMVFGSYAALWKRFSMADKVEAKING